MTVPNEPLTRDSLRELIAAWLDVPPGELDEDTSLVTLGMNSLEIMSIVNRLRRCGIPVTYDGLAARPTLTAWWRTITEAHAG
ncbi:phosphopantetheine-binding protein [Streptomyces sp. DSM 118878]